MACHLLDDRSGSVRMMIMSANALKQKHSLLVYCGSGGFGLLASAKAPMIKYPYRRSQYRIITLVNYIFSQIALFLKLFCNPNIPRNAIIWVNTLLPFGAALYGWLTARKVIYHVHEESLTPITLRRILCGIANLTATKLIYVSNTHLQRFPISPSKSFVVYNALNDEFLRDALNHVYVPRKEGIFIVLLLASNRSYKGVDKFVRLAESMLSRRDIQFQLVLNDGGRPVGVESVPSNLNILPPCDNPAVYYRSADVVCNLTNPRFCVETFGLTILESMAHGIPTIVPSVGGPAELVSDGQEGFHVNVEDVVELQQRVLQLADDPGLCTDMSRRARLRAQDFSEARYNAQLNNSVDELLKPNCGAVL